MRSASPRAAGLEGGQRLPQLQPRAVDAHARGGLLEGALACGRSAGRFAGAGWPSRRRVSSISRSERDGHVGQGHRRAPAARRGAAVVAEAEDVEGQAPAVGGGEACRRTPWPCRGCRRSACCRRGRARAPPAGPGRGSSTGWGSSVRARSVSPSPRRAVAGRAGSRVQGLRALPATAARWAWCAARSGPPPRPGPRGRPAATSAGAALDSTSDDQAVEERDRAGRTPPARPSSVPAMARASRTKLDLLLVFGRAHHHAVLHRQRVVGSRRSRRARPAAGRRRRRADRGRGGAGRAAGGAAARRRARPRRARS